MKSYKIFSILLILIILFSLFLTGCSPEPEVDPPENQEEKRPLDQEDAENNELNKDGDNEELDKSENEEYDAEKDRIEENEASEDSENSVESDGEDVEVMDEENSDSKDSSSDDTTNEEVSSDEPEDISQESEAEEENQKEEINILKIEGSVEKPLFLNLDDLKEMEDLIYTGTFYSLNSFGTTEYTDFKGVKLWNLLNEKALISEEASIVKVIALDGYSMEFTVDQIKRDDYIDETNQDLKLPVILAWEENGQEYDPEEGPPYKLVIGQKEPGDVNKPQWIRDIDKIIVE
ncbi:MAG: molybdopterin-dependent oxidoreductase [Tissierellales bacterium]|nr:molybdopterin-dependent oxidoreductase [Tissierellales bacterium]